ncbi:hypothetical protein L484_008690 [Morus notabilis]|uniref:Pentatricopeptide repeat-containing protein n=1 Tax=Morus notabilis TaxID=981085 RepID=W9RB76_9ROSA|nr:hypothetical protein L484_008690 [Morus notabilis]
MPLQRTNVLQKLATLRSFQNSIDARLVKSGFDPNTSRSNFKVMDALRRGDTTQARQVFDQMPHKNTVTINLMISAYVKQGNIPVARELFESMLERPAVTWTILIGAYSKRNDFREAFRLFALMRKLGTSQPDYVTFATLLSGCSNVDCGTEVFQVHAHVVKSGCDSVLFVCNSLIDSYCKTGRIELALQVFKEIPDRDSVTFNALITGYAKEGLNAEAVKLFREMQDSGYEPSDFTFAAVLCAGVGMDDVMFGRQVHALAVKNSFVCNVFVGNALLDFYSKHDCVIEARKLFDEMPELDGVSYNILIAGHAWVGELKEAVNLFRKLQFTKFDRRQFPFATMLSVAAVTSNLEMGRQIHSQAAVMTADLEILVANALVDMYAKCSRFKEAKTIFSDLSHRSAVPWTAMISAYVHNGLHDEGVALFNEMRRESVCADQATFASVLRASASLALLSLGRQLHSSLIRSGFMSNVFSGSALLDMYAKCGFMKDALQTFQEMPKRNSVSWNALISAYAQNGDGQGTFRSFEQMLESGFEPDLVSFLGILTACSHCGLVEEGLNYFNFMTSTYKLVPKREHYASIVDVLCRSGQFDEAVNLMAQMPFEPDEIIWSSVLNACRIHKNQELATKAASQLFNMAELRDAASYVNMSNIYAAAGEWESVGRVKKAMRERGMRKNPARSWVEIKHEIHMFTANDEIHPRMGEIRRKIDVLTAEMEREGYKPDTSCALHNENEEIKAVFEVSQ